MRKLLVGGLTALLIAATPLAALAQATALDEESRAVVVEMAQSVGASLAPGATASVSEEELPDPDVIEEPGAPAPQQEEPEPEPTSEPQPPAEPELPVEPEALPELNLTDLVEYTSLGVTFKAPADWTVTTDIDEATPFMIEVPGTELVVSLEADDGLDFPSWLGLALFRSQADLLITELGEDAQLDESTTLFTEQNLPMAKLAFSGTDNGEAIGGALYVTAPNENAYMMIGGGPLDEWEYALAGIELIAESLVFDEELITVTYVEGEPLTYADDEGMVELTVPAGWYVMSTDDPQFPVMASEPEVRFVAAIGGRAVFGENFDDELLNGIPAVGEMTPEDRDALFADIMLLVEESGSPIVVDEELSSILPRDGAATVRLVGSADLGDGVEMPVIFYVDLRSASVGVMAVFGDTESALAVEDEIQAMLESVVDQ